MTEREALLALKGDDPSAAARSEAALWQMWHQSGDPRVDALLVQGIEAMGRGEHAAAEAVFARVIADAPGFAEGWNKRATVRYLAGDYEGAVADCRETLARKPHHFGALSGQALCHMALGQFREAAELFRRTIEVHPHLRSARSNLRAAMSEVVKWN